MSNSIKNMLVGVFILGAISIIISVIMFLKPTIGDGKQVLYARFSDINKLHVGTRVLFGGKPVGEVTAMEEIHDAREQPTDELGRVYFYQLTLHVDSKVKVYNTDEVSIQTSGLMGERSISITPKAPPKGVSPKRISNQPIYANSVDPLQNAMIDFSDLAATMEETFDHAKTWISKYGNELGTTIRFMGSAMAEIEQATATINQLGILEDTQKSIRSIHSTLDQVQTAMDVLETKQTFKNIGIISQNLKEATSSIEKASENLASGKGTLGKLIDDNDLYLQLNAVMTKANNLMNDVNHYGLLFHLNKQWQRTRLKKITELNALSSPENFRTYFEAEVDDINASMARISMLIQKAENSTQRQAILQSPKFKRDFAELLHKTNELSDNLRLYNQQLNDAKGEN